MSAWVLPTLGLPVSLDRKTPGSAEAALKLFSSKLGVTNNFNRVTPVKRYPGGFPARNAPAPFTDPPMVRSEVWPNPDFVKSAKKRRWTRFKSSFLSCIRSVKCRFTALGILLGLIMSLGALIPIIIICQTSGSKSNTSSSSSNTATSSFLMTSTTVDTCNTYFCQESVYFVTNMTTTALTLIVTVQQTPNTTYNNAYSNYSPVINQNYTTSSTEIVYTFFIQAGPLPAGNYTCTVQFDLTNLNHTTSLDTYSITTTNICGNIASETGSF